MENRREPAVAGLFYPADAAKLTSTVDTFLDAWVPLGRRPKALIVPHAGYPYSGAIAGAAYAEIRPFAEFISRVVLLGPSHRVWLPGVAAATAELFATPLGDVRVDLAALAPLIERHAVLISDEAHSREHSLEVQLPFLQRLLPRFSIVPLVVGSAPSALVAHILASLWGGEETLIIISSDLSHFHDDATARSMDAATTAAIEALDADAIGPDQACGRGPMLGLLEVAKQHDLRVKTLAQANSAAINGDHSRVVGYGAYAIQ